MRVAWLAPYPVETLAPALSLARQVSSHPCSWIVSLAEALARRADVELHLLTESQLVWKPQTVRQGNVTFHVVRDAVPLTNRGWPPWLPWGAMTGFGGLVKRFGQVLEQVRPEVVHAHGTEHSYALAGLRSGFPCLVSIQGVVSRIAEVADLRHSTLRRRLEEQAVRGGKWFGCRTAFDTRFVRSLNPSARIFTLQEAMNPVYFRNQWEPREEATLLFVGGLERFKGLGTLLEALAGLPAARLAVIGGGDHRPWQAMCGRLGIAGRVEFLGFQTAEQIAARHRRAQVLVLCSQMENSPNALAEAMVSGMPVVATAVGGIPSLVDDGRSGRLVAPGDPKQLAAVLAELLADSGKRAALGREAQMVARQRHLPETVAEQTMRVYKEILDNA
jgi:glycosyltransferase involved in cell wall biosynthesis